MKLAVIGNKEFTDYQEFCRVLAGIDNVTMIISGGAPGTDTMARNYAFQNDILFLEFPPDYNKYGRDAKHIRDRKIVNYCDMVLAFWNGMCEGTEYTINYAREKNIPVQEVGVIC